MADNYGTSLTRDDIEHALRAVLSDEELVSAFWRRGHKELLTHSLNGTRQWIGGRLLSWVAGVLLVAGISLAIRYGFPTPPTK